MIITNWNMTRYYDTVEVSAEIDGFRLWYRFPISYKISSAGDSFLSAALLPAMLQGNTLEIDPGIPVSPKLIKNANLLMEIHHCWNPIFKIIQIKASQEPAKSIKRGAMSFFSGGVDSMYTFLKRKDQFSHIVFIQGFDYYTNDQRNSHFISFADIADLSQLAFKLINATNAVEKSIKKSLSAHTIEALNDYLANWQASTTLESKLVDDLNEIIKGSTIYDPQSFSHIALRKETQKELERSRFNKDFVGLNRLLIEDAFPLEIARNQSNFSQKAIERNTCFAEEFGKKLIPVETNLYAFSYRYNLSRNLTQGSALASVAHLLGFECVYIPSAYSYRDLIPLGSHPLTDPLYSNEEVHIVHDGAEVRRVDKIMKICKSEIALRNLKVCYIELNNNCGKCSKCLRTMLPLYLMGASNIPFPELPRLSIISQMKIGGEIELAFFKENFNIVMNDNNYALHNSLKRCMKRYNRKKLVKDFDHLMLNGFIKKIHQLFNKNKVILYRIEASSQV